MLTRRQFAKSGVAFGAGVFFWIPRIAIAKISGDAREQIIKSKQVLVDNWACLDEGSATKVAHRGYEDHIAVASQKMQLHKYVDFEANGTEFSRSRQTGCAMFGAWHEDGVNHCHHYFDRRTRAPLVYITTVPFIMHSYIVEAAASSLSTSSSIDALYPVTAIERFDDVFGSDLPSGVAILCATAVWNVTYRHRGRYSGSGEIVVQKRDVSRTVAFREAFDYDLSV